MGINSTYLLQNMMLKDICEILSTIQQPIKSACYKDYQNTLQEHQRIRTNATVSKDSEIVKIPK